MAEHRIETCATHGLRYDANQHDGCLLCRRLTEPQAEPAQHSAVIVRFLCAIGAVAGLAALLWFGLAGKRSDSANSCQRTHASAAKSCVQACGHGTGGTDCASDCMAALNERWGSCPGVSQPAPSAVEFVYAAGSAPDWRSVQDRMREPMAKLVACPNARGPFTALLEVNPGGELMGIAVGTPQRDAAECIAAQLATFDARGLLRSDYQLVVRGLQPTAAVSALIVARPKPAEGVRKPDPTLEPPAPAEEPSLSIQADEQEVELLRSELRAAKRACAGAATGCASAVYPLRSHFPQLPLTARADASHMLRIALNKLGAGFDCVRVDGEHGFETYTTIGVAGEREGLLRWRLVSAQPIDAFKGDVEVDAAPWPATYKAELIHLEGLSARDLSLCFDFENAEPLQLWYAGAATYTQLNAGSSEPSRMESGLRALGLKRFIPKTEKLQYAITHGSVQTAEALLAQGVELRSQHAALAEAIEAHWPLDKLELLLRAGANPNEVSAKEQTALHAAIASAESLCPERSDRPVAEAVKVLLKGGADPNLMTDLYGSPLHVAAENGCKLTWDVLVRAGANPRLQREEDGATPEFLRHDLQERLAGRKGH